MHKTYAFWATFVSTLVITFALATFAQTPEETIFDATEGRLVEPPTIEKEGLLPVEYIDSKLSGADMPAALRRMRTILNTNARIQDAATFGGAINLNPLGPYDPIQGKLFYVPYIPVPKKEFLEFFEGENLSPELKKFLFFTYNGVEFARFFIHPSRTSSYERLIAKYGIVRDKIPGFLAGSPRSFIVWNPQDPELRPFVVKTSLHFKVNDDLKINIPNKLHRSYYVNALMSGIDPAQKQANGFTFLPESAQMMPRLVQAATFYRELTADYFRPDRVVVPGYYLSSPRGMGRPPALVEILENSRNLEADAAEVLRPLLRVAAYMMYEEGMKGELHEQNVDFEIELIPKSSGRRPRGSFEYSAQSWGRLTGRIVLKDLDSFRVDTELRLRKGKNIAAIREAFKPFVYTKFTKASGWGAEGEVPLFTQEAYDTFIRDTFGYSFSQALKMNQREKESLYRFMGGVMAEEVSKVIGREVAFPRLHAQQETWLDDIAREEREKVNAEFSRKNVNKALFNREYQDMLKEEYTRLRGMRRTTALLGSLEAEGTYFLLHSDMIEVRQTDKATGIDTAIGFAALESNREPGQMQFEVRMKNLVPRGAMNAANYFRGLSPIGSCKAVFE